MIIDADKMHSLWLENDRGDVWTYPDGACPGDEPEGFIYQHSVFPLHVTHRCHRAVLRSEVDACDHPASDVVKTRGWIDGVEGRECKCCNGTQVKQAEEPWPDTWDAAGSREVFTGSSGCIPDLALALARGSLVERTRSLLRGYWPRRYEMRTAIRIASDACERCMNSLMWMYGLKGGYRERSGEWRASNTECDFCRHMKADDTVPTRSEMVSG